MPSGQPNPLKHSVEAEHGSHSSSHIEVLGLHNHSKEVTVGIWGPAPIDSADLYIMGLRAPRCNGCEYAKLKHRLGDKFLCVCDEEGWFNVYELDAKPIAGQSLLEYGGHSIRSRISFMSIGHSDECYHWRSPVFDDQLDALIDTLAKEVTS